MGKSLDKKAMFWFQKDRRAHPHQLGRNVLGEETLQVDLVTREEWH